MQRTHAVRHCLPKLLSPYIIQKRCYFNTTMFGVRSCTSAVSVGCFSVQGHPDPCELQTADQACNFNCKVQPVRNCQLALAMCTELSTSFSFTATLH